MIMPCLVSSEFKPFLLVLDKIILDIQRRWKLKPQQALPGRTTISISLGWKESEIGGLDGQKDLLAKFEALMYVFSESQFPLLNLFCVLRHVLGAFHL